VTTQSAVAPGVKPRRSPIRHKRAIAFFIVPFAALFAAFYLLPIGWAVYQSQYFLVFQNTEFWASVGRVLLFGAVQVPVMLGIALVLALLLDSPLVKGKKFFRLAFFVPYAVPGVIAAIMWGYLYSPNLSPFAAFTSEVDLLSPSTVLWSIANVVTWVYVGYNMLIIYSALLALPAEIFEAARLDGANQLQIAWSIKIPLVAPAITLTAIFSIIGTLQLLAEPQVFRSFTSSVSSTFTPNLAVYATSAVPNVSLAAAMSVVLALATFALSFGFLKFTQRKAD
jgi:multiple sugar transport system permease protein